MKARHWILSVVASVASVATLASGANAQLFGKTAKPAAVVNGTAITMAEVEAILKQAALPSATPLTEEQKKQMRTEAVGLLIDDLLLQQFLRKNGPRIATAEVDKRVAELADSLKKQKKTLADFYKESGQTEAQLRINVVNMMQWAAFVKEHLTDADIQRYYQNNKEFFDRVLIRASHIVLRMLPSATTVDKQTARAKLEGLRRDILAGKVEFAEAAKKYSQCTSAPGGGDIGYFPRKLALEENFARAAFALKVGDISDVVETDYGLHLIKVTDRKPGTPSDFNKIREEVRDLCIEEMRLAVLEQQRRSAKIEVNLP
jgi:peptidyl-prolyl cis-trans isomerase C